MNLGVSAAVIGSIAEGLMGVLDYTVVLVEKLPASVGLRGSLDFDHKILYWPFYLLRLLCC